MFEADVVKRLNDLELLAYEYINREPEKAREMTIRELAAEIHTSTTTIVRLAVKLGFKGWAEFKYYLNAQKEFRVNMDHSYENMISLDLFWKNLSEKEFKDKMDLAVEKMAAARFVDFMGLGTSDALAQYASRYFNNLGLLSRPFTDIFRPVLVDEYENSVLVVLSVSGETDHVLRKTVEVQRSGAFLISITNNPNSTLSRLSAINFSYNMLNEYATPSEDIKLTTQLPSLAIVEMMAYRVAQINHGEIIF
ncbi:MurR/RpiR family transcriptional regulator [Lactovum miscens]|uniref:DNA-binding MurR/RpiR family transcriptional regulator n=1 Tax=Lactovum miscens TaxID=190387 RepID=A0A841C8H5_9LACT|nr:MurR/RpiR family transcriptional regulator [Lactovum miscens]MBB5887699.1 DNA-binding MurR/RpiR family transcriptional regulator [Lactovum miscens]